MTILITPLLAALIAQTVKLLISSPTKPLQFSNFFKYSGMPSAHSAMMVSLVVIYFYSFTHYEMGSLELRKDENPFR